MRHASRSTYITLHSALALVLRTVTGAPVLRPAAAVLDKRAFGEGLTKGAISGYVFSVVLLVILSGITAGLTLGLMSLDETQLYVLSQSGSAKQKKYAAKIIPIRKDGHLLLVSLLLMNVISNETLPIISEKLVGSGIISVVSSTVMIVIFSEILPQAICSTHGLAIGAAMAVPVKIAIYLMFVVAWPVAKLLDLILGENHGMVYRRAELKELIDFHSKQAQHGGDLSIDAVTIMRGALDLQEKKVQNSMTYIDDVFMLHADTKLDRETIQKIVESGHSRIPIFEDVDDEASVVEVSAGHYGEVAQRRNIIGCLLAKNLLLIDPDDEVPLSKVSINHIPSVQDDLPLFDILNIFQEGRSHLAIVVSSPVAPLTSPTTERHGSRSSSDTVFDATVNPRLWTDEEMSKLEPIGIITLEDVLEELIQEPIWDETDAAEPRPRAGLAVPLNTGTGESLILATNRGRTVSRSFQNVPSIGRLKSDLQSPVDAIPGSDEVAKQQEQIEMVTLPAVLETGLTDYALSRSNSAAPADARLPLAGHDPFADDTRLLASQQFSPANPTIMNAGGRPNITNKHLSIVKPSRPLSLDLSVGPSGLLSGQVVSAGPTKNRFKSRNSSSSTASGSRRTQSAHTSSEGRVEIPSMDRSSRVSTFDDRYRSTQPAGSRQESAVMDTSHDDDGGDQGDFNDDDDDDDGVKVSGMSVSVHDFRRPQ